MKFSVYLNRRVFVMHRKVEARKLKYYGNNPHNRTVSEHSWTTTRSNQERKKNKILIFRKDLNHFNIRTLSLLPSDNHSFLWIDSRFTGF